MVTEVGAIEDVIRIQSRQAQLYWLLGDEESSAAAMAEAQRYAERVAWPYALAELAREHRVAAFQAASEAGHVPLIAQVLVGIADLALRRHEHEQAALLLAASASVRGLPDRSQPDVAHIEQATQHRLGEARFAEATQEGRRRVGLSWSLSRSPPERGERPQVFDERDPDAPGDSAVGWPSTRRRHGGGVALRSVCCAFNDDVAVPRAGVDRDLVVRRVRVFLRRNGVAHHPSLAVGVHPGGGALADADLDVS